LVKLKDDIHAGGLSERLQRKIKDFELRTHWERLADHH